MQVAGRAYVDPTPIPPNPLEGGEPRAARQADGKTLVLWLDAASGTITTDVCIARLNADGTSDNGFGEGGFVRLRGLAAPGDLAAEVLVREDGGFLGIFNRPRNETDFAAWIAWFRPDGRPDLTRGIGGISDPVNIGLNFVESAALLPDGRIVLAGCPDATEISGAPPGVSRMARLNADGSLDTSFGEGGCGIVALMAFGTHLRPAQVVVAADGTIFVTGRPPRGKEGHARSGEAVAVMKIRADGS
jgi:uncharacterized delta-60 repeat protein